MKLVTYSVCYSSNYVYERKATDLALQFRAANVEEAALLFRWSLLSQVWHY